MVRRGSARYRGGGEGAPRSAEIAARPIADALASCATGMLRSLPTAFANAPAISTWFRRV